MTNQPVLYLQADDVVWKDDSVDTNSLRETEKEVVSLVNDNNQVYVVVFDTRRQQKIAAGLGMGQTLLVMLVLALGSLALTKITYDLVISPIEAMMDKVKRISENPLKAAAEEENEQMALQEIK